MYFTGTEKQKLNKKSFYLIYIIFLIIIFMLNLFTGRTWDLFKTVHIISHSIALLGLIGYIYQFKLLNRLFWRLFLLICICLNLICFFYLEGRSGLLPIFLMSFIRYPFLILFIPLYRGIYKYSKDSFPAWNVDVDTKEVEIKG